MLEKIPIRIIEQKIKKDNSLFRCFSLVVKFFCPKTTLFAILNSLVISGVFCFALYTFAVTPAYNPGDTLDPACEPTDANCTVTSPAYFSFGSNNFSGTGSFTTTNTIQGGTLTDGTLTITAGALTTTGTGTFGQIIDSGLTNTRVPYANSSKQLVDSANLTFNGTTLTSGGFTTTGTIQGGTLTDGTLTITAGALTTTGLGTFGSLKDTGLTSGRIPYATTAGLLTDSASMTFNGTTLTAGGFTTTGIGTFGGNANVSQLVIKANASQTNTNPLAIFYKSDGTTELFRIHSDTPDNLFIGLNAGRVNSQAGGGSNGLYNTFVGSNTGYSNTTGAWNSAFGEYALYTNTTGQDNTAIGFDALKSNTIGYDNTAIGSETLFSNTEGIENVAVGEATLNSNTIGSSNIAMGGDSLHNNTEGNDSIAIGRQALQSNITGNYNIAIGRQALNYTKTGSNNTAVGYQAGYGVADQSFSNNSLFGYQAGFYLKTGGNNVLIGYQAGYSLNSIPNYGTGNVFIGYQAGSSETMANNLLYISNSNTATPLIYGDFSTSALTINGTLAITGGISGNLDITGDITAANLNPSYWSAKADYSFGANVFSGTGNFTTTGVGTFGTTADTTKQLNVLMSGAKTAASHAGYFANAATNITTDAINKYGLYVSSTGAFTGATSAVDTNNYGIYIATTAGADTNYDIYAQSGANLDVTGHFNNASSRELKENFTQLNPQEILDKINQLPVTEWSYKLNPQVLHISPVAEDFYSIFGVGNDNKTISTIDPSGIALVGIQALSKEIDDLKAQINANGTIGTGQVIGANGETLSAQDSLASLGMTLVNGVATLKEIVVDKLTTKQLCIDDVCVNRDQLKELLDKNQIQTSEPPVTTDESSTSDITAPIITLLGDSTVDLTVGDSYTDAGATASDNIDGDITAKIIVVNPVDTNTAGTYTISYNVSDAAGNKATEVTRTVIISELSTQTNLTPTDSAQTDSVAENSTDNATGE